MSVGVGVCSRGPMPAGYPQSTDEKFFISICNFDRNKDVALITCKTTSKKKEKLYPGEFILKDLFGRGESKICPYNIFRIKKAEVSEHKYIGKLDDGTLPLFKDGIQIAVQSPDKLEPIEKLRILESWEPIFPA